MPLADIPFLGAYEAQRRSNLQQPMVELQQASGAMGLMGAIQKQQQAQMDMQRNAALRAKIEALPPEERTRENILPLLLESGNMRELVPLLRSKGDSGFSLTPGQRRYDANGNLIAEAPAGDPKPESMPEIVRLQKYLETLPGEHPGRPQIEARIKYLTEKAGPQTVIMPSSSDLMQKPDGSYVRVRIGKDGRTEEIPLGNVRPPQTAAERAAGADAAKEEATLDSVRQRIASMTQKLQQNAGVVGPAAIVRRAGEAVGGIVAPDMPTPALDYNNEMKLLLADVRKVIEKDPNLSNQERQNLTETIGGGTFQTPGSAFRTLNNVMGYMENKRATGAKPSKGPQYTQEDLEFTARKHGITVEEVKKRLEGK